MKKILSGILCLAVLSCNRNSDQPFNTGTPPQQTNQLIPWLEKQKSNVASDSGKQAITNLEASLLISESVIRPSGYGKKVMITPIKKEPATREEQSTTTFLLSQLNSEGRIIRSNIVTYTPETAAAPVRMPADLFENYYGDGRLPDVKLTFRSNTGRLLFETAFRNGDVYSHSYPEIKNRANHSGELTENECVEWYWQTYVNGVLVSEVYLGTTCGPYVEEGSGGGGEDPFDEAAEDALKTQVFATQSDPAEQSVEYTSEVHTGVPFQWVVVKNTNNLWQVNSSDIAYGYNSPNTGAIVYNIQHNGSQLSGQTSWNRIPRNPGGFAPPLISLIWQETANTTTIANGYRSGTITVSGSLKNFGITIGSYSQSCTINVN